MAQLINPKVETKDGELKIILELNITITTNGTNTNVSNSDQETQIPKEEEKNEFLVPQFTSGSKVKFGKRPDEE